MSNRSFIVRVNGCALAVETVETVGYKDFEYYRVYNGPEIIENLNYAHQNRFGNYQWIVSYTDKTKEQSIVMKAIDLWLENPMGLTLEAYLNIMLA